MNHTRHPIIAGSHTPAGKHLPITNLHDGTPAADLLLAPPELIQRAINAAHAAAPTCAELPARARAAILEYLAERVEQLRGTFEHSLIAEAGKTLNDARAETNRCITTLRLAADAATTFPANHTRHIDTTDEAPGPRPTTLSFTRVPVGPAALITPFNFPLNLVAHKLGPAIATGNPFVLKPSDKAPSPAYLLAEILLETDYPKPAVNVLNAEAHHLDQLITDPLIRFISFTGSDAVGWHVRAKAEGKRVALELGGAAPCILDRNLNDAQLDHAAQRLAATACAYAGQSCISTQRIILHEEIATDALERFISHAAALRHTTDPRDPDAFIVPLIDTDAADRVESLITSATHAGATLHTGGQRSGNTITPAILSGVPDDHPLATHEAFGPVATVTTASDLDHAIALANDSNYAIHTGLFTNDHETAQRAARKLDAAGVIINDAPTFRLDAMPYGGIKRSGIGREGPAFALLEMTEVKATVARPLPA